jgi:hypothetical protein
MTGKGEVEVGLYPKGANPDQKHGRLKVNVLEGRYSQIITLNL